MRFTNSRRGAKLIDNLVRASPEKGPASRNSDKKPIGYCATCPRSTGSAVTFYDPAAVIQEVGWGGGFRAHIYEQKCMQREMNDAFEI